MSTVISLFVFFANSIFVLVNQFSCGNEVEYGRETGNFKVNERCIMEVGSKGKTCDRIANVPDSYILAGGIDTPYRRK